jgi:hypothetical protein
MSQTPKVDPAALAWRITFQKLGKRQILKWCVRLIRLQDIGTGNSGSIRR